MWILFLSYDGLTDQLGQSQILPYLERLHGVAGSVHILSFEKRGRFYAEGGAISSRLQHQGIGWTPLLFTSRPRYLAKAYDLLKMYLVAIWLTCHYKFKVIHCRSYQSTQVGLLLKSLFGCQVIFDMRGLWVDERVDGGLWDLRRWPDRWLYRGYKWIEKHMLRRADQIVSLTRRAVPELEKIAGRQLPNLQVIPCCADFSHFPLVTAEGRAAARQKLGLPQEATVLVYLGAIGTWYLWEEMVKLFQMLLVRRPEACFLLITKDWNAGAEEVWSRAGLSEWRHRLVVASASRSEVPQLVQAGDMVVSFIKPAYSKLASSPTKLGEVLAMGIPVICNAGVGDVKEQVELLQAGFVVKGFSRQELGLSLDRFEELLAFGGSRLRESARDIFSLEVASEAYERVYTDLQRQRPNG